MAQRLAPGAVAEELFGLVPDRDERASHLYAETLLMLAGNGYEAPADGQELRSPKRQRFASRSLALGVNFFEGRETGRVATDLSPQRYGQALERAEDLLGSDNLRLARDALQGLIDPTTHRGQPGGWLLFPFHESLLWYDARRTRGQPWDVRKVYMRGTGITLASMLLQGSGRSVEAIRDRLRESSPLARIVDSLEGPVSEETKDLERDERDAWARASEPQLERLARNVCLHADGVMLQGAASGPARLWQLRSVLALDLALHALRTAWDTVEVDADDRYLLLSFGGPPRAENRVRQQSEQSLASARVELQRATVHTLGRLMATLAGEQAIDWDLEIANRKGRMDVVIGELKAARLAEAGASEYGRIALLANESGDYGRAAESFRVLLDAIGMIAGTGQYRYLTAPPELLAALVGALSHAMPMDSRSFFARVREEWGLVVGQDEAQGTALADLLDGADLARNARRAELLLAESGLALGLSDSTVMVGERARQEESS